MVAALSLNKSFDSLTKAVIASLLFASFSIPSHAFKIQREDRSLSFQHDSDQFIFSQSWFHEEPQLDKESTQRLDNKGQERTFLGDVMSIRSYFRNSKDVKVAMVGQTKKGTLLKRSPEPLSYILTDSTDNNSELQAGQAQQHQLDSSSTSSTSAPGRPSTYTLVESISGTDFFSHFDFYQGADPTHGMVSYQSEIEALSKGLVSIDQNGDAVLKVDNTTVLQRGVGRDSVRLESKNSYSEGIILIDLKAMPFGSCSGVWPAFWTYGKTTGWPNGGEIDIIESIEDNLFDQSTLHTAQGCQITPSSPSDPFTGSVLGTDCYAYANQNSGCGIKSNIQGSYGSTLNASGGGVFVLRFDNAQQGGGATLWFFPRASIPSELDIKSPLAQRNLNPSSDTWGTPFAKFSNQNCDFESFIKNQTIVINTTLMGDWAGTNFNRLVQEGECIGDQADVVSNPENYGDAVWKISGVEVWQLK